jgi:hypothetical protein
MVITYDFKKVCSGSLSQHKLLERDSKASVSVTDLSKEIEKLKKQKFRKKILKEAERLTW